MTGTFQFDLNEETTWLNGQKNCGRWMKRARKPNEKKFSCEIFLARRPRKSPIFKKIAINDNGLQEDPKKLHCWKLYSLCKRKEARVRSRISPYGHPSNTDSLRLFSVIIRTLSKTDIKSRPRGANLTSFLRTLRGTGVHNLRYAHFLSSVIRIVLL